MGKKYLTIDVGGTDIKYGVIDKDLVFHEHGNIPTPLVSLDKYIDVLEQIYNKFKGEVEGIAMSVPGVIDSDAGVCVTGGKLSDFVTGKPIAPLLQERCKVPVTIMNDGKAAGLAEAKYGALKDCKYSALVAFGTGIAGALIYNGEILMGKHGSAGEFSSLLTNISPDFVNTSWSSRNGIKNLIAWAALARGVPVEGVKGKVVFDWIKEGDKNVYAAVNKFTEIIAYMFFNIQQFFDPEKIAVGGGISRESILIDMINGNLDYIYNNMHHPFPRPNVVQCKFFNDANLIGAFAFFMSRHPEI